MVFPRLGGVKGFGGICPPVPCVAALTTLPTPTVSAEWL